MNPARVVSIDIPEESIHRIAADALYETRLA
ncbi:MAG: hypothetical protein BECKG1743D_GA0114223_107363 [Candidatus Kentron sp. G]|nr:MAG: hypothetical protein BECKG1743F_GA0114225_107323 [Candidatus Kentron sp. G]VFN04336.1 MAG: hypothetical protein BECKG1743E_GA0114224_107163 [Candidatus Kentron sp. G]VFN05560.1 MAG: hypothetical protein BECKG1743D_GA0114223_107363 [Candidatus Kentron sp. G]